MKKLIMTLMLGIMVSGYSNAQHFFRRIDVSSSNLYSFVVANLASGGINYLTDGMLIDNYYSYTMGALDVKGYPDAKYKNNDIIGITARDVFNDITGGLKLGYQSHNKGFFNWCIYGSGHYKLNQFMTQMSSVDVLDRHRLQRVAVGGGAMVSLGDFENNKTKVILEAGLRYEMPIGYKGTFGTEVKDVINSGLSSHFAIRFGGTSGLQGLGVYADILHYNLLKSNNVTPRELKMYSFGIVYSISPWRTKKAYE